MRILIAFLLFASLGCSGSHALNVPDGGLADTPPDGFAGDAFCERGVPLPPELTGDFRLTGVGCQTTVVPGRGGSFMHLWVGPCGEVHLYTLDGDESLGTLRREEDVYVYDEAPRGGRTPMSFTLRALAEHRASARVLLLDSTREGDVWQMWAVRSDDGGRAVEVPASRACAVRQTWTLHTHDGIAAGAQLDSGERTYARGEAGPVFELGPTPSADWARSRFWFEDEVQLGGTVMEWSGRAGLSTANACGELDAYVPFALEGDTWTLDVDWLVLDVRDLDGDGRVTDSLVRRAHYEARADACAP